MEDDLLVARRALAQALTAIARLQLGRDHARRHLELIEERISESPGVPDRTEMLQALDCLRRGLFHDERVVRGVRQPAAPRTPPEELGATAIVCTCRTLLYCRAEVQQHWETGCFVEPEYETRSASFFDNLDDDTDAAVEEFIVEFREARIRNEWIKGPIR
jgi:hypothetical protein